MFICIQFLGELKLWASGNFIDLPTMSIDNGIPDRSNINILTTTEIRNRMTHHLRKNNTIIL